MKHTNSGQILVFCKDVQFMTSLCEILAQAGYVISGSTLWENALEILKTRSFDLFLADIEKPDMDGIALIRAAKKIDKHLINIIITEQDAMQTPADLMETGAFDYVIKPFRLEEFMMKISRAMGIRRLRKSEDMYRSIFENATEGIYLLSVEEKYIAANSALAQIFGYETTEDLIKNLKEDGNKLYVEPTGHAKFINLSKKRDLVSGFESQVYRKDGGTIWISESMRAVRDEDGDLLYYRGTVEDITGRKNAEESLRESEARFRKWAEKGDENKDIFLDIINDTCDSYRKLEALFMGFVIAIVNALEEKRPWMKGHSRRVAAYSLKIAKAMGLSEDEKNKLRLAALLHDIGEFFVYDHLLNDKSMLSDEEFDLIKRHPVEGAEILRRIKQLKDVIPLIRHHHERIDGKGYPDGLKGEEIPVGARIIHLADSYDSMTADRPYRRPAPGKEYAFLELKKCQKTQFDPEVTEVALKVL
jgi:PAS domain S-box-containing protein/putative nucleotidyltransferase with HDIG domain